MADFLLTEAAVDEDGTTTDLNDEGNIVNMTLTDEEFIDDSVIELSVTDYYILQMFQETILMLFKIPFLILIMIKKQIIIVLKMIFMILKLMNLKIISPELINLQKHYLIHKVLTIKIHFFILSCLQ